MTETLVLTLIGDDRPGLVEAVSRVVLEHGGNWEQSRMLRLGGKFAGILLLSVAEGESSALMGDLSKQEGAGLRIMVEPSSQAARPAQAKSLTLELVGNDRPGIVREIAQALASRGVNFEELTTGWSSAPMSGSPLFSARARLLVPPRIRVEELRSVLEALANDLMVDLTLAEASDDQ